MIGNIILFIYFLIYDASNSRRCHFIYLFFLINDFQLLKASFYHFF